MAVLKNKRKEGQLKVITLGDELTVYTLRMLCNESFFPKKSRWLLAGKIADLMNEFHQNLHVGNDIFVTTEEDAHERHLRQTRAYSTLYASASVMRTACDALDISLGCQMSQLVQLANLDHIDHYVKEHMHVDIYVRYMDDFIVVDSDKERLKECVAYIREALGKEGLSLNEKSCMHRLEDGIVYLHRRFILTETGKVVVRFDRAKIAQERRKLKKLKALLDSGKIGMDAVENHYQSWYSSAVKVSSFGMLKSMNKFYTEVFGILPKLKGTK